MCHLGVTTDGFCKVTGQAVSYADQGEKKELPWRGKA